MLLVRCTPRTRSCRPQPIPGQIIRLNDYWSNDYWSNDYGQNDCRLFIRCTSRTRTRRPHPIPGQPSNYDGQRTTGQTITGQRTTGQWTTGQMTTGQAHRGKHPRQGRRAQPADTPRPDGRLRRRSKRRATKPQAKDNDGAPPARRCTVAGAGRPIGPADRARRALA